MVNSVVIAITASTQLDFKNKTFPGRLHMITKLFAFVPNRFNCRKKPVKFKGASGEMYLS